MALLRSTDRILTTHVGSLPRPVELIDLYRQKAGPEALGPVLASAVKDVVSQQVQAGIDIVNDGEYGKPTRDEVDFGPWMGYLYDRLDGFELTPIEGEAETIGGRDRSRFPGYYASDEALRDEAAEFSIGTCVGAIAYTGNEIIARDIANLRAGISDTRVTGAFMPAITPDLFFPPGSYYPSARDEAIALGDALRVEYQAIVDAGFIVQIDDPLLVNEFEMMFSDEWDLKGFRRWAEQHVEIVNNALAGLPQDQVRYHVCWGSWKGPHSSDLPLEEVVEQVLAINAGYLSIEGANAQHEHEWEVWSKVSLPAGKMLVPGVVTHKTNIVEHPTLVAQRIIRYAEAVGRENVIASTDCGMGGRIHPEIAWAKLQALSEGAEVASQALWA